MKEYLKIIDEIIALVGLHLIPKFVNLYQGQVDISWYGLTTSQTDLRRNIKIGENGFMQTIGKQTTGIETNLA